MEIEVSLQKAKKGIKLQPVVCKFQLDAVRFLSWVEFGLVNRYNESTICINIMKLQVIKDMQMKALTYVGWIMPEPEVGRRVHNKPYLKRAESETK